MEVQDNIYFILEKYEIIKQKCLEIAAIVY